MGEEDAGGWNPEGADNQDRYNKTFGALCILKLLLKDFGSPWRLHLLIKLAFENFDFFLTDAGHHGVAARGVQEGDQIVVLEGFTLAMVSRPAGNGYFEMIAPAFVVGIMDGEAWPKDEGKIETLTFA
jgi:hypothetical protein